MEKHSGVVCQLVDGMLCTHEVVGSSPINSKIHIMECFPKADSSGKASMEEANRSDETIGNIGYPLLHTISQSTQHETSHRTRQASSSFGAETPSQASRTEASVEGSPSFTSGAFDGPTSIECPSSKQFCIARLQPLHHHGSFEGCIPKI